MEKTLTSMQVTGRRKKKGVNIRASRYVIIILMPRTLRDFNLILCFIYMVHYVNIS